MITTEEGLACLHTAFHGQFPYLGIPALLYCELLFKPIINTRSFSCELKPTGLNLVKRLISSFYKERYEAPEVI